MQHRFIALALMGVAACGSVRDESLRTNDASSRELAEARAEIKELSSQLSALAERHSYGCDKDSGACFASWQKGCAGRPCEQRSKVVCAGLGSNRICYRDLTTCEA